MTDGVRTEPEAIRVLLVDDHDLFRTGLANLLEGQHLDVVGQATRGAMPFASRASSRPTSS